MKTLLSITSLISLILFSGCVSTPQTRIDGNPNLFASFTAEQKEKILKGEVALGFTPDMVLMAAGSPDKLATRRTAQGTSEVWTYLSYAPHPISYAGYHNYFSYNSGYHCYVRQPYSYPGWGITYATVSEEKLVVELRDNEVVSFETRR